MIRPILRHGRAELGLAATSVTEITSETQALVDDMIETMHAAPGIGLAAPQIGVSQRVFVVDLSVGRDPSSLLVLVNPQVVERTGLQLEDEGCLSVPGFTATVARPGRLVVEGLDRQGRRHRVEGTGLLARAFQHELDHLDGRLFLERLRRVHRWAITRRIHALTREGRW